VSLSFRPTFCRPGERAGEAYGLAKPESQGLEPKSQPFARATPASGPRLETPVSGESAPGKGLSNAASPPGIRWCRRPHRRQARRPRTFLLGQFPESPLKRRILGREATIACGTSICRSSVGRHGPAGLRAGVASQTPCDVPAAEQTFGRRGDEIELPATAVSLRDPRPVPNPV